jgi:hypothetical protein
MSCQVLIIFARENLVNLWFFNNPVQSSLLGQLEIPLWFVESVPEGCEIASKNQYGLVSHQSQFGPPPVVVEKCTLTY